MKRVSLSQLKQRTLQVLLSVSLVVSCLLMGLPLHSVQAQQQTSTLTCPVLPAHFDFAHATLQELRHFHIPLPPAVSDHSAFARWLKDVQKIKKIVCLSDSYTHPITYQGQPIVSAPLLENCPNSAPHGTTCSYNWNGYTVSNGTQGFNDAYGTWNIPCVTDSDSSTAVSNWVGLGGVQENLWQGGSSWDAADGYFLWYEAVGSHGTGGEQEIVPAHCGETVRAEVSFTANDPSSNVSIDILDVQSGTTYTKSAPANFTSGDLTAEWIDERPKCGKGLFGLADYGYSQWRDAYASTNDANSGFSSIGSFTHTRLWMANNDDSNTRIAWADKLGSDKGSGNDNFKGYWEAHGNSKCG